MAPQLCYEQRAAYRTCAPDLFGRRFSAPQTGPQPVVAPCLIAANRRCGFWSAHSDCAFVCRAGCFASVDVELVAFRVLHPNGVMVQPFLG